MYPRLSRFAITVLLTVLALFEARLLFAQWTPPIGVPAPSFGITENAPPVPNPWTSEVPGFYYVDYSTGSDARTYGYPGAPRKTIPCGVQHLPAGSVVQVVGTYPYSHTSPYGITADGTADRPVFIRGTSAAVKPLLTGQWQVKGTYFVLEYLEQGNGGTQTGSVKMFLVAPVSHGVIRHCDIHGSLTSGGVAVVSWDTSLATHVVIWDNDIHDNGNVNADYDQDVHGIAVTARVSQLWVVDNRLARNSGDGLQINGGNATNQATTHHIYVGRNVSHGNKQSGLWTKQANDVIFSENVVYAHRPSSSSMGAGMGFQYAPDRVWFLFNRIHDCEYGLQTSSDSGLGTGRDSYYIGNVIYNIHASSAVNAQTSWSQAAMMLAGGINRYIVANTIWDADAGINSPGLGQLTMVDNIIDSTNPALNHIFVEHAATAKASLLQNTLFVGTGRIKWGSATGTLSLATLTSTYPAQGLRSVEVNDPGFVNAATHDFRLSSGSPARGLGAVDSVYSTFYRLYGIDIAKDAARQTLPAAGAVCDIGAFQYAASGVIHAPTGVVIR